MKIIEQITKFIISGGVTLLVGLSSLYVFTEFFGVWYLFSVVLSFMLSLLSSFALQKFWTFKNKEREKINQQILLYLGITVLNLAINVSAMYFLVEKIGLWYIWAQIVVDAAIAIESFFVYKNLIFKN